MSHEQLMQDLREWRELGWIRRLEEHFADFLIGLEPGADVRMLLAATMTSHQLGKGHVCLSLADWIKDPLGYLELPPEPIDREAPEEPELEARRQRAETRLRARMDTLDPAGVEQALERSPLVGTGAGHTPLVLDRGKLYLRRTWRAETGIVTAISKLVDIRSPAAGPDPLGDAIREIFAGTGDLLPEGPNDPDWQQVACALAARSGLTIITGGPGTGKTWTVVRIIALLQLLHPKQTENPLRIRLAAPTGKAAQRLSESINQGWDALEREQRTVGLLAPEAASTLHRLLGSQYHTRHFRHDRHNPLPADVVIVDEASMIDQELMHSLLDALAPATRLILLGDKDQLASVEAGAVFGDLCRDAARLDYSIAVNDWLERALGYRAATDGAGGLADHRVMLRLNRRSTEAINELARAVNCGAPDQAIALLRDCQSDELEWPSVGQEGKEVLKEVLIPGYRAFLEAVNKSMPESSDPDQNAIDRWARECLSLQARFQVLTALKQGPWGVSGINRLVNESLGLGKGSSSRARAGSEWFHGRPVLITRNDYSTGLMNGDIGLCLAIPDGRRDTLRVVFSGADNRLRYLSPSRLRDCQTAWAMTVHKSQGSEFTHTVLVLPDQPSRVLTRELVYTGLTRARERFTLVAPNEEVFRQAVEQRTQRSSALAERLDGLQTARLEAP